MYSYVHKYEPSSLHEGHSIKHKASDGSHDVFCLLSMVK